MVCGPRWAAACAAMSALTVVGAAMALGYYGPYLLGPALAVAVTLYGLTQRIGQVDTCATPAGPPSPRPEQEDEDHVRGSFETFSAAHAAGDLVIDVRDPSEFRTGHVAGAVDVPNGELRARLYEVPRKVPVYLICANGARSLESARFLRAVGVQRRASAPGGGMLAWLAAGRPLKLTGA